MNFRKTQFSARFVAMAIPKIRLSFNTKQSFDKTQGSRYNKSRTFGLPCYEFSQNAIQRAFCRQKAIPKIRLSFNTKQSFDKSTHSRRIRQSRFLPYYIIGRYRSKTHLGRCILHLPIFLFEKFLYFSAIKSNPRLFII